MARLKLACVGDQASAFFNTIVLWQLGMELDGGWGISLVLYLPSCLSTHTVFTGTPLSHSSYCYSRENWCPGQKGKLSKNFFNLSTLLKSFSEPQGIVTHY